MKVFVTGASGFLGKFLVAFLERQGYQVIGVSSKNCNLMNRSSLERYTIHQFDQIYHLAAWTQAGDFCLRHPGEQWIINQVINTNVLDWWQSKQPQAKLIAMGTSCSYDPDNSLKEENYLLGTPIDTLYTYAMTKRMLLCGLQALNKQFGLEYLYFVPSTLYGAGYHTDGRQLHFIFDLVRKILEGHLHGRPVVLWGDGYQKRELIHVQDFIQCIWKLIPITKNTILNIGSGEEHTIREFAEMICGCIGYSSDKIQYDTNRYTGARSKVLAIERLKELYPEHRPMPLRQGIEEIVEWFSQECLKGAAT